MKECIICKESKEESRFPPEHVIPKALGGGFTISSVGEECNNDLGNEADGPLINSDWVELFRWSLGLEGQSGRVPFPIAQVHLKENPNQKYRLYRTENGLEIRRIPDVDMEMSGNNLEVNISLDDTEEDEVFEIVNTRLRREGIDELSEDQKTQLENMMEKERIENPTVEKRLKSQEDEFLRGFIKIAYELGCEWIDGYRSDDEAEKIRCFLENLGQVSNESLSTNSLMNDYNLFTKFMFGTDQVFDNENVSDILLDNFSNQSHVIWMKSIEKPECGTFLIIDLFGLFKGAVRVSKKAYPVIQLLAIDPTDRQYEIYGPREMAEKLSRHIKMGNSNRN